MNASIRSQSNQLERLSDSRLGSNAALNRLTRCNKRTRACSGRSSRKLQCARIRSLSVSQPRFTDIAAVSAPCSETAATAAARRTPCPSWQSECVRFPELEPMSVAAQRLLFRVRCRHLPHHHRRRQQRRNRCRRKRVAGCNRQIELHAVLKIHRVPRCFQPLLHACRNRSPTRPRPAAASSWSACPCCPECSTADSSPRSASHSSSDPLVSMLGVIPSRASSALVTESLLPKIIVDGSTKQSTIPVLRHRIDAVGPHHRRLQLLLREIGQNVLRVETDPARCPPSAAHRCPATAGTAQTPARPRLIVLCLAEPQAT